MANEAQLSPDSRFSHPASEGGVYLVRYWRALPGQPWRFCVQNTVNGKRLWFASLDELFVFFWRQAPDAPDAHAEEIT